ncbi:MAG: hypothetical protein UU57_C0026G0002 [Candidatus Woesebacteria bacterium GW2011_GWE1_41_24]|uniref:Uncharacterized protein n=1 Tax=Candidatus Woesebacteria bacterium GW2011_GWE1_41_24 TaxID=1618597 RepID=A0A0G0VST5_9BACT|nr:MAG: hypothetical protein UU57_C0026G0002 [Candidatus Woesebacteria bacterium GW2011_GWE1_41_24]
MESTVARTPLLFSQVTFSPALIVNDAGENPLSERVTTFTFIAVTALTGDGVGEV